MFRGGGGVAERTTASVPTRTVTGLNLDHGQLLSLGRQLSRERGHQPPIRHGRNLQVPNLKCCQNQNQYQKPTVPYPTTEKITTQWPISIPLQP